MNKGYQNFKKKAGKLAIALTLVGSTAIGASAATTTGVTKASVNMRTGAGTQYKVITKLKADKTVRILGEKGNWYKVKYNGKTGYISKSYVLKKNYTVEQYSGKYITKTSLNVRKGAGTSYLSVGKLAKGTIVDVIGKTSNGWLKIKYNGATRYISGLSKYVEKYTEPVEENNAPTISVADTYTITKGEDFDYAMLKAKAEDKEDGDLTSKIDFSGVVNTGKVGEYTVKLTVKDSKGATATKTVKVIVKDVVQVENNAPVINVKDVYTLTKGDNFDYAMLKATASDKEDGDLTSKIDFSGVVDTGKVGEYTVKLTVKDSKGATATKTVKVVVKDADIIDNQAPVIAIGVKTPFQVTQNRSFSPSDLNATAFDKEESRTVEITYSYKDEDGKDVDRINTSKLGEYTVILTAKDKAGNTATKTVKVQVVRNIQPTISCNYNNTDRPYYVGINEKFDVADLGATANDTEDGSLKVNSTIYVLNDAGDSRHHEVSKIDTSKAGKYEVVLTAKDTDGGSASKSVKVIVGDELVNNHANLTLNNGKIYYVEEGDKLDTSDAGLVSLFKARAVDVNGKDITSKIVVLKNENIKLNQPGSYQIKFQVTASGRAYVQDAKVVVNPNEAPTIDFRNSDVRQLNPEGTKFEYKMKHNARFETSLLEAFAYDVKNVPGGARTEITPSLSLAPDTSVEDGKFTVVVKATDSKGLVKTANVYVILDSYTDNQAAPVISYASTNKEVKDGDVYNVRFEDPRLVGTKEQQQDSLKNMLNLKAIDSQSGDLTSSITYSLDRVIDTKAVGKTYKLTVKVTDKGDSNQENKITTTRTITIKVVE